MSDKNPARINYQSKIPENMYAGTRRIGPFYEKVLHNSQTFYCIGDFILQTNGRSKYATLLQTVISDRRYSLR